MLAHERICQCKTRPLCALQSTGDTDTTIQISSSGGFASGYNAGAVDQTVVLQNADLTAAGTLTDAQVIQNLLAAGKLQVD